MIKYKAFTLAEVLITLGIIGVVAAITIPSLVQNILDKQYRTMWKKKYAEIAEVYTNVRNENIRLCINNLSDEKEQILCRYADDGRFNIYTTISPAFVNEMVKHFKVIDSCGKPEYDEKTCSYFSQHWVSIFAGYGYYGSLKNNKPGIPAPNGASQGTIGDLYTSWDYDKKAILLQDGSVIYFGGYGAPMITVDVNGFENGPNVVGRDVYAIMLNENWMRPIGADKTFNPKTNGDICQCGKDFGLDKAQGIMGSVNLVDGEVISGACCSAKYLYEK